MRLFGITVVALSVLVFGSCAQGGAATSAKIRMLKTMAGDERKKESFAELEKIYQTASYHRQSLEKVADRLVVAKYNDESLIYIAGLIADCGFHTEVLMDVADAASRAHMEIPEFRDIGELAVIKLSESDKVSELAAWASTLTDAGEMEDLRLKIRNMKATAECKTVEEAKERVKKMLESLNQTIKKQ